MGLIIGPLGSLYVFKVFEVVADLYRFPYKPPKITFGTKIYNPNIVIQEKMIGSDPICHDIIA